MKVVTAVQLRQSLTRLAKTLERTGEPILLKVGRTEAGVIISVQDFRERFALRDAEETRRALVDEILSDTRPGAVGVDEALSSVRTGA